MATLRHPFEVIKEVGQGLDFAGLGRGAGQELSNRLTNAGYNHTFDGLDRFKFDGSGGIDTYYGTIDAIRNKGFVEGRRGAAEQALVFQPWHDRKEARAMRAQGVDLPDPDAPRGGQARLRAPMSTGMDALPPIDMPSYGMGEMPQINQPEEEPWYMQLLRNRRNG